MAALNDDALLIEHGNIWVGSNSGDIVDLGAVRNVRFTGQQVKTKINSDNRGTVINKSRIQGMVAFDWLECADIDNIEVLFKGLVTKSSVAGTPVVGATQALASPFVANTFYEFANQQGDGTVPTSVSLSGATDGALTLADDYFIIQNPNTGKWGVVLNTVAGGGTLTTLSQVVTITYSYTPAAAKTLTFGTNQTATNRYIRIIGPSEDSDSTTRQIDLDGCIVTSDMLLPFVDVENANDVGVMPVTAEMNKGEEVVITDEINAA